MRTSSRLGIERGYAIDICKDLFEFKKDKYQVVEKALEELTGTDDTKDVLDVFLQTQTDTELVIERLKNADSDGWV